MDPIKLAEDFTRVMKEADAPIIAYELVSRSEEVNHAHVLTTRTGLENLARMHAGSVCKARVDLHEMCLHEHCNRADREDVMTTHIKESTGYNLYAYAFND